MSKLLSTIDILTDTWQTVITRVNSLIDSLSTEIITANSTTAETGSLVSPRHARLFGQFSANSIATNAGTFIVNNNIMTLGTQFRIQANNSVGLLNYVLTSGGSSGNLYWSPVGGGTVTSVANGSGLIGGPINTTGTLSVKAGPGIIVNASGVSVDTTNLGTVRSVANGSGLNGGAITSTGTLSVKAGSGIIVNASGVSVDTSVLGTVRSVANGVGLTGGTINTTGTLAVKAGTGIVVDGSGVAVRQGTGIVVDGSGVSISSDVVTINEFTQSLSASGYTKLPNGLIMCWGTTFVSQDGNLAVSFPTNLFTNAWNVQLTWQDSTTGSGSPMGASAVTGLTKNGFTIYNDGDSRSHYWLAIGN
jgi:hypothetical protein